MPAFKVIPSHPYIQQLYVKLFLQSVRSNAVRIWQALKEKANINIPYYEFYGGVGSELRNAGRESNRS